MTGRVIFIGAGPGAADLITVRGARRLAQADVVLFDALTDPALRELAPQAQWIDVGKRGFCHSTGQATIDALLVRCAREHASSCGSRAATRASSAGSRKNSRRSPLPASNAKWCPASPPRSPPPPRRSGR